MKHIPSIRYTPRTQTSKWVRSTYVFTGTRVLFNHLSMVDSLNRHGVKAINIAKELRKVGYRQRLSTLGVYISQALGEINHAF